MIVAESARVDAEVGARRDMAGRDVAARDMAGRDVSWSVLPAPWGPVHIAASASAIVAVALRTTDEVFVEDLRRRGRAPARARPAGQSPLLARTVSIVARYAEGEPAALDDGRDLPLDLDDFSAWDRAVLGAVRCIPAGRVTSYGRIARTIGRTGAARAVGGAVGRNPIGLLIPCHRVIAGDGNLGGYGGSWYGSREENLGLKRRLLEHEGVSLPAAFGD